MADATATTTRPELTIDELAARVGMTVRNLREWRTLGLMPKAEMRGRVGFYPVEVVGRIERIKRLHAEGFTLELIARLLAAGGDAGEEVVRLAETLRAPLGVEPGARLARLRETMERLGLDEDQMLGAVARIQSHTEQIAGIFEQVWMDHVWAPFVDAGMPEDDLPDIQRTAAEVKPLAMEAVTALFAVALDAQIERGIARQLAGD